MNNLVLSKIIKDFGNVKVIKSVDLEIKEGEFCVFVGPSGCGKSTLLRMVAGLEELTAGSIKLGDKDISNLEPAKRGIAMVFQSYALYPHMTVEDNMGFGLKMAKEPKETIRQKVSKAAEILQIEALLKRKPKELSGGQRQRVAIGRAIVRDPEVFLFDEPLSNLDAELRVSMRVEIARLHKKMKATMIYVTHDQVEAMTLADKIVILRAGVIEQVGKPLDLFHDPDNVFVAGFLGTPRMNFIKGIVKSVGEKTVIELSDLNGITVEKKLNTPPKAGSNVLVGIRPQYIETSSEKEVKFDLHTEFVEHFGTSSYIYTKTKSGFDLIIEVDGHLVSEAGTQLPCSLNTEDLLVFDDKDLRVR